MQDFSTRLKKIHQIPNSNNIWHNQYKKNATRMPNAIGRRRLPAYLACPTCCLWCQGLLVGPPESGSKVAAGREGVSGGGGARVVGELLILGGGDFGSGAAVTGAPQDGRPWH